MDGAGRAMQEPKPRPGWGCIPDYGYSTPTHTLPLQGGEFIFLIEFRSEFEIIIQLTWPC
ncbi:MAG: hypothetical protein A2W76_08105 [Gammaproteobacteria bacterium RIFCSPLOWO2_12_47_11]|nr:MAG: hypothetical protein A2W76_08105 [Gammaproteobacteria bacterium RIFCSPLOWO2_12_47_11]